MKRKKDYFLWVILFIVCILIVCFFLKYPKNRNLNISKELITPLSNPLITPTLILISTPTSNPIPTPTLKPTSTPTPTKIPTPTPTSLPLSSSSEQINTFIDKFSSQYSIDADTLRYIALCESGFNSSAVNKIYVGLFQFNPTTWKNIRQEIGEDINPDLRFSAEESIQTAAYALSKGKGGIWPNCLP